MLKNPVVSEKSMNLSKTGFYTFHVSPHLSKESIARQVSNRFKVDVLEVRTVNLPGKKKRQRTRKGYFITSPSRKAIVKIKPGQKIPLFENLGEEKEDVVVKTGEGEEVAKVKEKKSLLRGTKVRIEKDAGDSEQGTEKKKNSKEKGEKSK